MALTNAQYDEIMRGYEQRQTENRHRLELRTKEIYEKEPRLTLLDDEISSTSVSSARLLLSGDEAESQKLRERLTLLQKEKSVLIASLGYPKDYLAPTYTCADCKDTGYIGTKKCHCFRQSTFSFSYYSDEQTNPATGLSARETAQNAVAECRNFIAGFTKEFSNLFLYGDTGVGKTFLSNCVAKELLDRGHSVIYFTAFELFHVFEKNVFERAQDMALPYQNIFDCDLLIIDDLGTELSNSFTVSQLFLCLNERILRKKSTIISTNLGLNQLAEIYSERTFSRISSNYTMIKLFGDDIRIKKKLQ